MEHCGIWWYIFSNPLVYPHYWDIWYTMIWLVVSTPLKNISQMGLYFTTYGKIKKHVPNHQPVMVYFHITHQTRCPKVGDGHCSSSIFSLRLLGIGISASIAILNMRCNRDSMRIYNGTREFKQMMDLLPMNQPDVFLMGY